MNKIGKIQFVSSFWIKVLALLTMTLSHIAILIGEVHIGNSRELVTVFDSIGRLALPLFCFGIAEGVIHTKSFGKYSLRLGIMASLVSTALLIARFIDVPGAYGFSSFGNIFIDLILGATAVWLLKQDKKLLKPLSILPIAISLVSFVCNYYEYHTNIRIDWFPWFLRSQYGFYGVLLIVLFYFATKIADAILSSYASKTGLEKDVIFSPASERLISNLLSIVFLVCASLVYCEVAKGMAVVYQYYAMLSGLIIFFYNGKRGYNAKWFQMGCYLYYPLHMIIILAIYLLISL